MRSGIVFFAALASAVALAEVNSYLTLENDTFISHQDNDYTHGTKLEIVDTDSGFHYMGSQTMYAPADLRQSEHIVGDRPYCGMALLGVGHELFKNDESPWSHYAELNFGMIGPAAGCKQTQKTIHKWLGCKDPKGWDNQLHNEFVVNAQYWLKYNYFLGEYAAIVPRLGMAVGTIQDFADIGVDLKVGYHIRRSPTSPIIFSASQPSKWDKLSAFAFAGIGERYYLYNHILEGSLFGSKDDGLDVAIEPFVTELRFGFVLSYDRFFCSYIGVLRTDEFRHQKNAPDYGGICIGWTF